MHHALVQHVARITDVLGSRVQGDITDVAIILGAISAVVFLIQYSFRTRMGWRHNAAGRAIVALDVCLAAILIPSSIHHIDARLDIDYNHWITVIAFSCVPLIIIYRIISLERGAHSRMIKHRMQTGDYKDPPKEQESTE